MRRWLKKCPECKHPGDVIPKVQDLFSSTRRGNRILLRDILARTLTLQNKHSEIEEAFKKAREAEQLARDGLKPIHPRHQGLSTPAGFPGLGALFLASQRTASSLLLSASYSPVTAHCTLLLLVLPCTEGVNAQKHLPGFFYFFSAVLLPQRLRDQLPGSGLTSQQSPQPSSLQHRLPGCEGGRGGEGRADLLCLF